MNTTVGAGRPVGRPSTEIDDRTAQDLLTGVRDLAAAVTAPSIGRAERLSRARRAADEAAALATVADLLDPYRPGSGHNRVADLLTMAGHRQYGRDLDGAAERITQSEQRDRLASQLRATATVPALRPITVGQVGTDHPAVAAWLDSYASPATSGLGPAELVPKAWTGIPDATINPSDTNPINGGGAATLDGESVPWTVSAYGVDEARQLLDWSADGGAEIQRLISVVVDAGLERALLADLTAAAPTATDLDAAETAIGTVWPVPADLIIVHAADRPAVVRHYGTLNLQPDERPTVLASAGGIPGTAVIMASTAVHVEASALAWQTATRPRELGSDVVAERYGRATVRMAGAVQTVVLVG